MILTILVCSIIHLSAQSKSAEVNNEFYDLTADETPEETFQWNMADLLEQHKFLDNIENTQELDVTDWITLYNIVFADPIEREQYFSPATRLYKEITESYPNHITIVSIAKVIELPEAEALQALYSKWENGQVEFDKAKEEFSALPTIEREAVATGFVIPLIHIKPEMEIKAPEKYQFWDDRMKITSEDLRNHKITYNTTTGENQLSFNLLINGKQKRTFKTTIYNEKKAEKYKKRAERSTNQRMVCNVPYIRNFDVQLTTGLPCTGGCPNQANLMEGGSTDH